MEDINMGRLSKIKKRLTELLNSNPIPVSLTPEREEEITEKVAQKITDYNLNDIAWIIFGLAEPFSPVIAQLGITPLSVFLETLGINTYEWVVYMSKRDNVNKLIRRIEELKRKKLLNSENS